MLKKTNEQKILEFFFDHPTSKFHLRELARKIKLNPNTISAITNNLINKKILKKNKTKFLVELEVNRTDEFKFLKKINNLQKIYESNLSDFIKQGLDPESISLIGSYSNGEDIETSDIDLVIISEVKKDLSLKKFEKLLKRKIHLIVTNYNSISDEFYANLINGIVLQGFIRKK